MDFEVGNNARYVYDKDLEDPNLEERNGLQVEVVEIIDADLAPYKIRFSDGFEDDVAEHELEKLVE